MTQTLQITMIIYDLKLKQYYLKNSMWLEARGGLTMQIKVKKCDLNKHEQHNKRLCFLNFICSTIAYAHNFMLALMWVMSSAVYFSHFLHFFFSSFILACVCAYATSDYQALNALDTVANFAWLPNILFQTAILSSLVICK